MRCASASDSQTSSRRFPDCYALGFGGVVLGFWGLGGRVGPCLWVEDLVLSVQDLGSV